ncbi:MAG: rhomboid family intramembrane serine protease [Candidatus Sumerlaeia bacterium]|nr:rhomboid family intramembrane serine protease [Candidatus Sumerlaeia bacterium]
MPAPQWLRDLDASVRQWVPPATRALIYSNVAVFVAWVIVTLVSQTAGFWMQYWLSCTPLAILWGCVWQFGTYMFIHSDGFHLLFNMLMLWFIGPVFEHHWGRREYLRFYFLCGAGAGLVYEAVTVFQVLTAESPLPFFQHQMAIGGSMVGASGAIYGLLFAFGYLYPDQPVLFGMLIPMPARVMVAILIAVSFLGMIGPGGASVANLAHLAGMGVAYGYLRWRGRPGPRVVYRRETHHR